DIVTAESLHPHIKQHQIRGSLQRHIQGLLAAVSHRYIIACPQQMRLDDFAVHPVVINDHYKRSSPMIGHHLVASPLVRASTNSFYARKGRFEAKRTV